MVVDFNLAIFKTSNADISLQKLRLGACRESAECREREKSAEKKNAKLQIREKI